MITSGSTYHVILQDYQLTILLKNLGSLNLYERKEAKTVFSGAKLLYEWFVLQKLAF